MPETAQPSPPAHAALSLHGYTRTVGIMANGKWHTQSLFPGEKNSCYRSRAVSNQFNDREEDKSISRTNSNIAINAILLISTPSLHHYANRQAFVFSWPSEQHPWRLLIFGETLEKVFVNVGKEVIVDDCRSRTRGIVVQTQDTADPQPLCYPDSD